MDIVCRTDDIRLQNKYEAAISGLKENVQLPFAIGENESTDIPVLIEGCGYQGVWLESGPLEGLVYGLLYDVEVAKANHLVFFDTQREDGYINFTFCDVFLSGGTGAIQMVVPIAKTAFEVYKHTQDEEFLEKAYVACARWDVWLSKHRDSRRLNLCELFCMWDTGHDGSTRFGFINGIPMSCPNNDARIRLQIGTLPWLAPDLSATLYGGRVALSHMARELNRHDEADEWRKKAEQTRRAILALLFDPQTLCFYDLDCNNRYISIVSDALSRVLCECVVDQSLFESIFARHIVNPYGFWAPFPMPSVAVSDPMFDHEMPSNSWGGPSQALTALRAPRWYEHYGKYSELVHMMKQWLKALTAAPDFAQQMDPWTGRFSAGEKYSPSMCVMIDYVARLYGVRWESNPWSKRFFSGECLEWNCRLPDGASMFYYAVDTPVGRAELKNENGTSILSLDGKRIFKVEGICRVVTDRKRTVYGLLGTEQGTEELCVTRMADGKMTKVTLGPNCVTYTPFDSSY